MKFTKVIFASLIFCVLLTSFTVNYFSTTWAGTADNQAVTFTAMQDAFTNGILLQKVAMSSSLQLMTKSAVSTYAVVDSSYSPFSSKSSGQLVVKSDVIPRVSVLTGYGSCGCATLALACSTLTTPGGNYYTYGNYSVPVNGAIIYQTNTSGTLSSPLTNIPYTLGSSVSIMMWSNSIKYAISTDGSGALTSFTACP